MHPSRPHSDSIRVQRQSCLNFDIDLQLETTTRFLSSNEIELRTKSRTTNTMPYVSREERERQRELKKWITMKEAVAHVVSVDKCDPVSAVEQLRCALMEGELQAYWGTKSSDSRWPIVKYDLAWWRGVPAHMLTLGLIPEDFSTVSVTPPENAPVRLAYLLSNQLFQHWAPLENAVESQSPTAAINEGTGRPKRVPASEDAIRHELKAMYDEAEKAGTRPPNAAEAFPEVKKRLAPKKVSRQRARPIIKEFEDRRWDAGQRSPQR
jgi:hypothetical protein